MSKELICSECGFTSKYKKRFACFENYGDFCSDKCHESFFDNEKETILDNFVTHCKSRDDCLSCELNIICPLKKSVHF